MEWVAGTAAWLGVAGCGGLPGWQTVPVWLVVAGTAGPSPPPALDCAGQAWAELPLCLPGLYSALAPPPGPALLPPVRLEPVVLEVELDRVEGRISLLLQLSVKWREPRITLRPDLNSSQWAVVNFQASRALWLPDISVADTVEQHRLQSGQLRVRGDKTVNIVYR